jgi:hypothetical protein
VFEADNMSVTTKNAIADAIRTSRAVLQIVINDDLVRGGVGRCGWRMGV